MYVRHCDMLGRSLRPTSRQFVPQTRVMSPARLLRRVMWRHTLLLHLHCQWRH